MHRGLCGRRGVHMAGGGHALQWGTCMAVGACVAGDTATAADGTHPTGMLSCVELVDSASVSGKNSNVVYVFIVNHAMTIWVD